MQTQPSLLWTVNLSGSRNRIARGSSVIGGSPKWALFFLSAVDSYPSIRKAETTYIDEQRAQELERSYPRLQFFDRVYLAQMQRLKLTKIYSNDRAFDRAKGIKRIFA